jgi:ADP-L-glycero-D-manno-heptose 6-epimerase
MTSRKVLVTGSAGFIGSHTAAGLHTAGWTVTGVDLHPPKKVETWESITADAADPALLARVAAGEFEVVVHQAAISDTLAPDNDRLQWANTTVPQRIAHACAESDTRFVYASSGSVYGAVPHGAASLETDTEDPRRCSGPLNAYARSKLAIDRTILRRTDLKSVGLRYTNIFGPGEESKGSMASILWKIVTAAATGRPVRLFDDTLSAARDFLPVQSLVQTLARLLDTPQASGVYNLGSQAPIPFGTLLDWCTEWAGTPVQILPVPNPVPSRYQYWTCVDMRRLRNTLPDMETVSTDTIRCHAHQLFDNARHGSPPIPTSL